jgi:ADP-heptose:LPS heptosyltransferase
MQLKKINKVIGLNKENSKGIKHYCSIKDKICIYRACGGYGDILMSRMIFEDLKKKYPHFHITYAVPQIYFQILKDHPFIDNVIDCAELDKNKYNAVFNITHSCLRYEVRTGKDCDKNRSDIWAESFGLNLENHNMYLPKLDNNKGHIISQFKKYGYQEGQKIILFTPYSAVPTRHLISKHRQIIESLLTKTNAFCFCLHNAAVLEKPKIPFIVGKNLIEAMSYVYFSDLVITTDTGHLHCAGGYNKPTLGFFNYTNGSIVGKHYKNLTVVQKTNENDSNWTCGPCNDIGKCPHSVINNTLKCYRDLPDELVENKTTEALNKWNI